MGLGPVAIALRDGLEIEHPLEAAVAFLEAYTAYDSDHGSGPSSFEERDLRRANRGGARISAAEKTAVLGRRRRIERALRSIEPDASLAASEVPWPQVTRLFGAFSGISGIGFSKMTKALHPKRPALIPMLDSVVQTYLGADRSKAPFAECATALVRSYKGELDRNLQALRKLQRELARSGHRITEVRLLDVLIWSALAEQQAGPAS